MRNPRLPAWARPAACAAALTCAIAGFAPGAAAEDKFQKLVVFGDSYADVDIAFLWRVYPLPLQEKLGIPQIHDFAIGGATTVTLPGQVDQALVAQQLVFGPRDLVTISIGGNDGRDFLVAVLSNMANPADAPQAGAGAATNAVAQIQRLINAGGQTFALAGFSGLSALPSVPPIAAGIADAFGAAYFSGLQTQLLPYAQSGVRFFLLDQFKLGLQVQANFARYGLTGVVCPVAVPVGPALTCGGGAHSPLQQQYFIGPDGLHPTNRGFEILADYMANIVMAPDTIGVQPGLVSAVTGGFTGSLLNRLTGVRQLGGGAGAADGPMGLGAGGKAAGPAGAVTSFAMGTFQGGDREERTDLAGYKYEATAGTAGIEVSLTRNLIFGVAGNYTTADADLTSDATIDVDAIQGAAYMSYATRNAFADVLFAFGAHDLNLARPGVLPGDVVRSSTDATAVALAARTGYLFDFGALRAGPIAGLTYVHTRVNGYSETGDPLLTFNVATQTVDTLTGSVGVRLMAPFKAGGGVVVPYLNITLEHQFGDDTHTLTASLQQAALLPILTPVAAFDTRTYGRVEGGLTFQLGADLSATFTGSTTFARDEGEDYRFSAGLNFRF